MKFRLDARNNKGITTQYLCCRNRLASKMVWHWLERRTVGISIAGNTVVSQGKARYRGGDMGKTPSMLLREWISCRIPAATDDWLDDQLVKLGSDPSLKSFHITSSMIARKLGKNDLNLSPADLQSAEAARSGWNPSQWSIDVAARVLLLITLSTNDTVNFSERFKEYRRTADVSEALALYCGLPLYDEPKLLVEQVAQGLRTNIKAEFEAIAHQNPFPAEQFEESQWNNMVLKSLFIGAMLEPISGLDRRTNAKLAQALTDYAHERWAADRFVSPEIWRCIGPYAKGDHFKDFQRIIDHGTATGKRAIALALKMTPESAGRSRIYAQLSEFDLAISDGVLTWTVVADEMIDSSFAKAPVSILDVGSVA